MSPRFLSSLLKPKKALDALLDEMAMQDNSHRPPLEAQRKKVPSRQPGDYNPPEEKGTEFQTNAPVIIPAKDLAQAPDPATAEFFKESDPEFEFSASGMRRVSGEGDSPEWETIHNILRKYGFRWLGRVSDGSEMWGKGAKERVVYDPASRRWLHSVGGVNDLDGAVEELEKKIDDYNQYTPKFSSLKSCVACDCGGCLEHDKTATEPWCDGCNHAKKDCTCAGCQCPENPNRKGASYTTNSITGPSTTLMALDEFARFRTATSKTAVKTLYHVCRTEKVPDIKQKGILPLQPSNWVQEENGERYGEGEIFAFDNTIDAVRWAAKMDWDFFKQMGTGKISIISFAPAKEQKWVRDTNDPMGQAGAKGKWLKMVGMVKPEQIQKSTPVNHEMVKATVQGKTVEFEKEADTVVYGMDQPIGGSGNSNITAYGLDAPIGGTDDSSGGSDDPNEDDAENAQMDMTSSEEDEYDPYDYDAEDARLAAEMDAVDAEHEKQAHFWASVADSKDDMEIISAKIGSTEESGWFAKSARPNDQKIELLIKQFKLTKEQIEECIKADPSPNQTDFVGWLAKFLSKGAFKLPEDAEKMKGQLEKFQKFKKSPNFTFNKDIQQYDPVKLFETLEQAGDVSLSNKEKKREVVRKGAEIVVQQGDITVYRVTETSAAVELGGGTAWCTATPGNSIAATYLEDGPLYIFFDSGSAVAQLHCESNQFMNRTDVGILESVMGDSSRFSYGEKKFLADPSMAKALGLLADKESEVKKWVMEHVADPEEVKKILGEAATKEIETNAEHERDMEQYNKDLAVYEEKRKEYQPKQEKWQKQYDAYQTKLDAWYKSREEGEMTRLNPGERPKEPAGRPNAPTRPYNPSGAGSYGRYGEDARNGPKFHMQVRNALATGTALPPEIEARLVEAGVSTQLLLKYGSLFHPGQPWEPLAQAILKNVERGGVDKEAIDYASKFVRGRWLEIEPFLLNKLFLQTRNMENMRNALDYAKRGIRGRWPEFEDKIAKAKPGVASGYGAAEYAIFVVKMPWTRIPGIKKKKNGKINAEECMIVGSPGEARKYAEAFFQGQRWEQFEQSALAADNLVALTNYAADTLHARMPELEEKILAGTLDAQESKGGRRTRWRSKTDLPLEYATKVIKGRWPEYEAKILEHIKAMKQETGYNSGEYKPSRGVRYHDTSRLGDKVSKYIQQVIQGRWSELEQILMARYQELPASWVKNQNLLDGYLVAIDQGCRERHKNDPPPPPEINKDDGVGNGGVDFTPRRHDNELKHQPHTQFTQDVTCIWTEGEQRLVTRDAGFEKALLAELQKKATDPEYTKDKEEKYVATEELMKMQAAPENLPYAEREKRPSWTIWNGYWVGWYGMEPIEKYVEYMFENGQDWDVGIDIVEIDEKLDDVRGRGNWTVRKDWRRKSEPEAPASQPQQEKAMAFSSSLLNRKKKALVEMHDSPTMLPPRDDLKRHLDQVEQDEAMNGVMDGTKPNTMRPRVDMIDPRINPDGVVASKQADYDDQDWMDDEAAEYSLDQVRDAKNEAAEYSLDQVRDAKNEAKRHFMEEDYLQQQAVEDGMTMDELWKLMGEEFTAEFYGYPYHRVEDFTDAPQNTPEAQTSAPKISSEACPMCKSANVRHIDDDAKGYNSGVVLAECRDCRGYYSLLQH